MTLKYLIARNILKLAINLMDGITMCFLITLKEQDHSKHVAFYAIKKQLCLTMKRSYSFYVKLKLIYNPYKTKDSH